MKDELRDLRGCQDWWVLSVPVDTDPFKAVESLSEFKITAAETVACLKWLLGATVTICLYSNGFWVLLCYYWMRAYEMKCSDYFSNLSNKMQHKLVRRSTYPSG